MSETIVDFFVPGIAKGAGSKRAFVPINKRTGQPLRSKTTGRIVANVVDDTGEKGKDWRADVKAVARDAYTGDPLTGPLIVEMLFVMQRPKAHYRAGKPERGLRPDAPVWHTSKFDATKLLRSVEDALTGIVWVDDNAVMPRVEKVYGARPGVRVRVMRAGRPALFAQAGETA
jgi:Holliday junction resolvase RusA-like endonuclease